MFERKDEKEMDYAKYWYFYVIMYIIIILSAVIIWMYFYFTDQRGVSLRNSAAAQRISDKLLFISIWGNESWKLYRSEWDVFMYLSK